MHNFDSGSSEYDTKQKQLNKQKQKKKFKRGRNMRCQNHKLLDIILNKENYKKKLLFTNCKNTMNRHRC